MYNSEMTTFLKEIHELPYLIPQGLHGIEYYFLFSGREKRFKAVNSTV
jgi:hypothetical protein